MAAAVTHHDPAFRRAQKRVLGAVMFCYLFYYTGRQTFGFAIPGIQAELGLDKQTLGWVSAGMLWAYAIGQAINGNLGDRFGGRRMMSLGTVLSFVLNWATSFGTGLKSLAIAWSANGLAQSMGWAPGSRLVANWFGTHERGKAFGF
jgi:OPA family glycerol-3-phosphate transporter-like MFS transporter